MTLRLVKPEETFNVEITPTQRDAIEYMAKSEVDDFLAYFREHKSCWYCLATIDPDEAHDGHAADCIFPAVCDLATEFDSE